ncbi:hypothetical protein TVAG_185970 [Trichomonas vaginalis G3]|uniref:Uncharacterized protein n=1 Tax=Trichomonas vaginalis (strain ATCC PRA-98 / G3) TaxID=412133 RepID=A2D8P0_TRIV3|nr:hypothetical protein TVAGG3_0392180 [Trichomonas vaginalis G3]EAY23289.1 hypothetical protein TVAG_185970 [Trichomonas vaginalis G3]KAI5534063.1 hypothetical protein TVAGG3_0392180 [Trichomonas vaginalis G3]|eukprot:XP_001584275.1 hypothetical protein [Trichomonas vaginalis G3]
MAMAPFDYGCIIDLNKINSTILKIINYSKYLVQNNIDLDLEDTELNDIQAECKRIRTCDAYNYITLFVIHNLNFAPAVNEILDNLEFYPTPNEYLTSIADEYSKDMGDEEEYNYIHVFPQTLKDFLIDTLLMDDLDAFLSKLFGRNIGTTIFGDRISICFQCKQYP